MRLAGIRCLKGLADRNVPGAVRNLERAAANPAQVLRAGNRWIERVIYRIVQWISISDAKRPDGSIVPKTEPRSYADVLIESFPDVAERHAVLLVVAEICIPDIEKRYQQDLIQKTRGCRFHEWTPPVIAHQFYQYQ